MVASPRDSIESNEPLNLLNLTSDEAERVHLLHSHGTRIDPSVRIRSNRRSLISIVSLIFAIVGVSFLVSFSSRADSKSSSNMKTSDLHTFDSISGKLFSISATNTSSSLSYFHFSYDYLNFGAIDSYRRKKY